MDRQQRAFEISNTFFGKSLNICILGEDQVTAGIPPKSPFPNTLSCLKTQETVSALSNAFGTDYQKSAQNKQRRLDTRGDLQGSEPQSSDVVKAGGLAKPLVCYYIVTGLLLGSFLFRTTLNDNTTRFSATRQYFLSQVKTFIITLLLLSLLFI